MADRNLKKTVMRLDKFLGETGYGTRSQIKEMVRRGRVQMNGQVVKAPELKVNPDTDEVMVDGAAVGYARMEYYMLNKPQGVVSATSDNRYQTVVDLIEDALRQDLFPVGRLDIDTEGLLLITNDGEMAHSLLSPKKHVDKVYMARLSGALPTDAAKQLKEGLKLEDGTKTLPAELAYGEETEEDKDGDGLRTVFLTIHEGKFHQVKRMFEVLNCHVEYLKRISMGPLVLDENLRPGEYRPLSEKEVQMLKDCGTKR